MRVKADTVIRWDGLAPPSGTTSPDELHGLALRVEWGGYPHDDGLIGLARLLGVGDVDAASVEERLRDAIDRRTRELRLPNGCVVVPPDDRHRPFGGDALTAFALASRANQAVWIACKYPVLHGSLGARRFSLLIPWGWVRAHPEVFA